MRKQKFSITMILIMALVMIPLVANAAVIHVATNGNNTNDGSSWQLAKLSIRSAITAASADDEVWVASGTYDNLGTIRLKSGVHIYGGFAGTETDRNQRDLSANMTNVGLLNADTIESATIDGFTTSFGIRCNRASITISHNKITGTIQPGGICCLNNSSPLILENTITGGNKGVDCYDFSSPLIVGNTIQDCAGMGICASREMSMPAITGNTITGCRAGINISSYVKSYLLSKTKCTITGNWIKGNATGIGLSSSCSPTTGGLNALITNNVIAGNGRGISTSPYLGVVTADIVNNTVSGNTGIGIVSLRGTIKNNIVTFNGTGINATGFTPVLSFNNVFGNTTNYIGVNPGVCDISVDPLFVDTVNGDFGLAQNSPCIDAGTNDGAPNEDILKIFRPIDGNQDGLAVPDIGAYEFNLYRFK